MNIVYIKGVAGLIILCIAMYNLLPKRNKEKPLIEDDGESK